MVLAPPLWHVVSHTVSLPRLSVCAERVRTHTSSTSFNMKAVLRRSQWILDFAFGVAGKRVGRAPLA